MEFSESSDKISDTQINFCVSGYQTGLQTEKQEPIITVSMVTYLINYCVNPQ